MRGQLRRHVWPLSIAVTAIAVTAATLPAYVSWAEQFHGPTSTDLKNAISRASLTAQADGTTTAVEALASQDSVADQRAEPDPELVPTQSAELRPHAEIPEDEYAMAGGCYALQSTKNGKWVRRNGTAYEAAAADVTAAEPFHFQATDLGSYLLWDASKAFVTSQLLGVEAAAKPSTSADWSVKPSGSAFVFTLPSAKRSLTVSSTGRLVVNSTGSPFALAKTTGCPTWPEAEVNVTGAPFGGQTSHAEVRGYLDGHTHGMAFEFLGGDVHCGRPWHRFGVEAALKDCPDHEGKGAGAVLENFTRTGSPVGTHDPVGWPTFKDWPAPDSLTHEGTYWKWLERAWRGGQRILVNLLVENNQLCMIYPIKHNSCNDTKSVRLQADDMRKLERYIDAQYGGPGRGWYRIVTDPFQAREVINQGKLAVVMGIETSVVFGCGERNNRPRCTAAELDAALDDAHRMGVRQMELVNKFDNGLAGVAGDSGTIAPFVNGANFLETATFWDMRKCENHEPGVEDRTQLTSVPDGMPAQDELFGAIAKLHLGGRLPVYPSPPTCNVQGLSALGERLIRRMADKHMLFDPDHMSVAARKASMALIEELGYPGVFSSHSWSTPDTYPRIYRAGGVITPYAGDSAGFVDKWRQHLEWADPRYYFGFGYGADINGLGAQGDPRGANAPDKVTYPFAGLGGVQVSQQVSGQRTYDINVDGVAHYGLYPDWIEDLRKQAGDDIADDMARGAEAYLQMWERAEGVTNDACRDPSAAKLDTVVTGIATGSTAEEVLRTAGQPHTRLGNEFTYCTTTSSGGQRKVTVTFDDSGKVSSTG